MVCVFFVLGCVEENNHWSGSETSAHVKSRVEYGWYMARSLHVVVDKAYAVGAAYNYAKKWSTRSFSNGRVVMQLPEYGCQFSCERKSGISCTKGDTM